MAPRTRVLAIVAVAALAAAGAVVGGTLLQTRGETTVVPGAVTKPRTGTPPLELDFGVRSDARARALARAQRLYDRGEAAQAAAIFRRYRSLEAQLGSAFAGWKGASSLAHVERLAAAHPGSALAELHLGWAYYWAGRNADALAAWKKTAQGHPDSPYGVDAEDILHPKDPIPGLPVIVTGLALPRSLASLAPAAQLAALRRGAAAPDEHAKILYGQALWNLKRPASAERQFAAAARLAPQDPLARTLAAVGRFTKSDPAAAFGKLGPLTAVFPNSPVVEFHLGVLLLYISETKKAETHLRAAIHANPHGLYAKQAKLILQGLAKHGTT